MTAENILIGFHAVFGTVGLLLGPAVMLGQHRRLLRGLPAGSRSATGYLLSVLLVALSAVALVAWFRRDLWWLIALSVFTAALAISGEHAVRIGGRAWTYRYVHGLGGSYIALTTAFLVVALTVDGPVHGAAQLVVWLGPTVVGTVLITGWRRTVVDLIPTKSTVLLARVE